MAGVASARFVSRQMTCLHSFDHDWYILIKNQYMFLSKPSHHICPWFALTTKLERRLVLGRMERHSKCHIFVSYLLMRKAGSYLCTYNLLMCNTQIFTVYGAQHWKSFSAPDRFWTYLYSINERSFKVNSFSSLLTLLSLKRMQGCPSS